MKNATATNHSAITTWWPTSPRHSSYDTRHDPVRRYPSTSFNQRNPRLRNTASPTARPTVFYQTARPTKARSKKNQLNQTRAPCRDCLSPPTDTLESPGGWAGKKTRLQDDNPLLPHTRLGSLACSTTIHPEKLDLVASPLEVSL